jgi:hypothetical protein
LVIGRVVVVSMLLVAVTLVGQSCSSDTARSDTGGTQRGFTLIGDPRYDGPQWAQSLREMVEVGATWVEFTPAWGQEARNASVIARRPDTPSDDKLERVVALAHTYGLKVLLIPHVYLPHEGRSLIRPDHRGAWFASYTAFISHYAAMAQRLGVEQFAVGSELSSISDDRPGWLQVIKEVRALYHGTVLYAADWGDEALRVPFWDAVDMIGIDAYWPLSTVPTTDVSVLQRSWEPIRAAMAEGAAKYGRKILFTEAGYVSQEGATTAPNEWELGPPSEAEQAAAYQALLTTFSDQEWWEGVYWWVWNALPDDGSDHATNYSPRGKAAEQVIRQWWQR